MADEKWDLGDDFTGNEDTEGGFPTLDAGTYEARVFKVTREVGKESGKPYLKWDLVIADGQPFAGQHIWFNTSLSEKSRWFLVKVLKALGIEVGKGKLKVGPADLEGKKCRVTLSVIPDDYANERDGTNDQTTNEVKNILPSNDKSKAGVPDIEADEPKAKAKPKKEKEPEPEAAKEAADEAEAEDDFDFGD